MMWVAQCKCGTETVPVPGRIKATVAIQNHIIAELRLQVGRQQEVNAVAAAVDSMPQVTELSHRQGMRTIAFHPSIMKDFIDWLWQRQCMLSPLMADGSGVPFQVILPQTHVWESLMNNPRDDS